MDEVRTVIYIWEKKRPMISVQRGNLKRRTEEREGLGSIVNRTARETQKT